MSVDVHLKGKSMEQRIADRLKPSTCEGADVTTTHGTGPTRVVHSIHLSGHKVAEGTAAKSTSGTVANNPGAKSQSTGGNG